MMQHQWYTQSIKVDTSNKKYAYIYHRYTALDIEFLSVYFELFSVVSNF